MLERGSDPTHPVGSTVLGLGFRIEGLGFRVWGLFGLVKAHQVESEVSSKMNELHLRDPSCPRGGTVSGL